MNIDNLMKDRKSAIKEILCQLYLFISTAGFAIILDKAGENFENGFNELLKKVDAKLEDLEDQINKAKHALQQSNNATSKKVTSEEREFVEDLKNPGSIGTNENTHSQVAVTAEADLGNLQLKSWYLKT